MITRGNQIIKVAALLSVEVVEAQVVVTGARILVTQLQDFKTVETQVKLPQDHLQAEDSSPFKAKESA